MKNEKKVKFLLAFAYTLMQNVKRVEENDRKTSENFPFFLEKRNM